MRLRLLSLVGLASLALGTLPACSASGSLGSLAGDAGAAPAVVDEPPAADRPGLPVPRATIAVAAGGASTCVKTSGGAVKCWGHNGGGALGIGDTEPSESVTPVATQGLSGVQAVFGGEVAQAALDEDGNAYLWGDMFVGDLGNGMTFAHLPSVVPSRIGGIGPVSSIAVGRYFTCLLDAAGDVRCYGTNDRGQLGLGDTETRALPTTVKGLDAAATSVGASMGGVWACATTVSGAVYCWGASGAGAPGLAPQPVAGLPGHAAEVVVGRAHACARLGSGKVTCWGEGDGGQLGDGARRTSAAPVTVLDLTDVVSLAAGADHTCARRQEGSVLCWGANESGQASPLTESARPVAMVEASFGANAVSCGTAYCCARNDAGRVRCWGATPGPTDATF